MDKKRFNIFHRRRFRFVIFGVLVCSGLFAMLDPSLKSVEIINLSSASDQSPEPDRPDAPVETEAARSKPALATNPSVNAVTETAVKMGVLSCVSRINQVASFLTANVKSGVYIFSPKGQPDKHIFSTSFELLRPDDSTLYASASFFPNQDAVYDTVEYVDIGCEELEKTVFKNLRRISVLKKNIILLNGGNVKVFLMPAGSGTVVIKKEVIP